ncbi:protein Hook homolog 3 isoform X2 [Fundulus heteroclitus]|uniref:protein Hook homolog 3 isoform X2 n=1 Tax=Fundulus heteroclitus TaxID=8078 RepID=UPI00165B97FB|nr:protein Hook homolog 3 isoform X2 [Fundulus heteroclitus]
MARFDVMGEQRGSHLFTGRHCWSSLQQQPHLLPFVGSGRSGEDLASPMDYTEENISRVDMLEKIAELDHSQSQLRELNAEMRHWLDVADDDMAGLRSENADLRKQVKDLEKVLTELQQAELEPCGPLLADGVDEKLICEKRIQELEKETLKVQEENKELTTELKNLKQERDQDKISLIKLRSEFEHLEIGVEEVQMELQRRDELIHQKTQQCKHLEETVEEYSNIIKDLRLTKQELSTQLENRRDEASFATMTEVMREEEEGQPSPHMSIAEEIQLLFSSAEMQTCTVDSTDPPVTSGLDENVEADDEGRLKPRSLPADLITTRNRFAVSLRTTIRKIFMFGFIALCFLAFVVFGCWVGNSDNLFINTLLMMPPYVTVHYKALPPI